MFRPATNVCGAALFPAELPPFRNVRYARCPEKRIIALSALPHQTAVSLRILPGTDGAAFGWLSELAFMRAVRK